MNFEKSGTFKIISFFIFGLLFADFAAATPNLMTFQSRIVKPDGKALEGTSVSFRFSITDALGTCVIYQEDFVNRNMSGTKGLINLNLGGGTKVYPVSAMDLSEVFNNYNFPSFNCQAGGTVNAGATDRRRLVMQFNDGAGWQTVPAMDINSNPYALQAAKAYSLGDYPAADYLRTASFPTCNPVTHALTFNGSNFTCMAVAGGSGTVTQVTSANADIGVATMTTTPVLTLNSSVVGAADKIVKLDASGNFGAINASALTNLNATNLASGTVPAARMPALTGDVTLTAGTTATTLANSVVTDAKVSATAGIARSKLANGTNNSVVVNNGSGVLTDVFCADGQIIKWVAGAPVCATDANSGGDVTNSGNSFASAMTIGTNDNNILNFETNGTNQMTILANGNVGAGTMTPTGRFQAYLDESSLSTAYGLHSTVIYRTTGNSVAVRGTASFRGGASVGSTKGGEFIASTATSSGADLTDLTGTTSTASHVSTTSRVTNLVGAINKATISAATGGLVTNAIGSSNIIDASVGGSITDARAGYFEVNSSNAITIGTAYGVHIGNVRGTNKFSLYATDASAPSFFAGNVGIGTTTPNRMLEVAGPIRMTPTTLPGTPAAGDIAIDSGDSNKLKWHDGTSWQTIGTGGGSVTNVSSANGDIGIANGSSTPTLTLNSSVIGAADKIVKLDASGNFGAINASALTNLNATNLASGTVPAARMPALTGDVTTSAGAVATTIAANAISSAKILDDTIVDADINASAAIGRAKIANGTANHVLINSPGGTLSSEAQLAVSRGGTGLGSYTNNALIMANGTGTALTNATCSTGEILMWNVTTWACTSMASSSQGYFKDGGNTFTGTATIGTNSNHNFDIETNGTTKMTVLANGNVGVGTTGPASKLDVSGTISISGLSAIYFPSDTTTGASIAIGSNALSTQAGAFAFYNTAVGYQSMGSGTLTSAAQYNGAFGYRASANLTSGYGNNSSGYFSLEKNTTGNLNTALGHLSLRGAAAGMTGSQNVAIGSQSLYSISNGNNNVGIGLGAGNLISSGSNNTALGRDSLSVLTTGGSNIALGYNSGSALTTGSYNVILGSNTGSTIAATSNNILISDGQGNERMRIDSSGNVGIGTTTPTSQLHTASNAQATAAYETAVTSAVGSSLAFNKARGTTAAKSAVVSGDKLGNINFSGYISGAYSSRAQIDVNVDAAPGAEIPTSMTFSTGDAFSPPQPRLHIASSGYVGVGGNTTPTSALDVVGAVESTGGFTANFPGQNSGVAGVISAFSQSTQVFGVAVTSKFGRMFVNDSSGNTQILLHSNGDSYINGGNVGVGTTTPGSRLSIVGDADGGSLGVFNVQNDHTGATNNAFILTSPSLPVGGESYFNIGKNNSAGNWAGLGFYYAGNNSPNNRLDFQFHSLGTPLSILASGNVGIGNTSPSYTLDVTGTMRVTGQAYTTTGNGSFTILSDARYKDVHSSFNRGLEDILNVNTIRYNYVVNNPLGSDPTQEYVGVTAQNLQKAIPEAVKEKDGYLTVNTSPVLWTLVNAVKEIYSKLVGQDEQIAIQSREIASKADKTETDAKIKKLEAENAALKSYLCSKDPSASICE